MRQVSQATLPTLGASGRCAVGGTLCTCGAMRPRSNSALVPMAGSDSCWTASWPLCTPAEAPNTKQTTLVSESHVPPPRGLVTTF